MKNKTVNKKIIKAMSIGLAAMMTIQPVLATPVLADDDAPENEPEPEVAEVEESETVENDSFESHDAAEGLSEIRDDAKDAATYTSTENCGNELDFAVCSARDGNTGWDAEYGGKALNEARDAIVNEETGIKNYDDKFAIVDANVDTAAGNEEAVTPDATVDSVVDNVTDAPADAPAVLDVAAERAVLSNSAIQFVNDAKRGVDGNFDKTTGNEKNFDARDIAASVKSNINSSTYTEAAKNLDTAVTEESKALATLYNDMAKADDVIEQAALDVNVELNKLENAETEEAAKAAFDKVEQIQQESQEAYEAAEKEYKEANAEYQKQLKEIEILRNNYNSLLEGQLGYTADKGRTAAQAKKELDLAMINVSKLEQDAIAAQENLKNTVIANIAQTLEDTSKPGTAWDELDNACRDLVKYYYFPSIGIDPSEVIVDEEFTKFKDDSSKNYLKATVGDVTYYFNYKRANTEGQNSGNIVIFQKNFEAGTEETITDTDTPYLNDNFTNYINDKENNSDGILDMTNKDLDVYKDVEKVNTLMEGYKNVETKAATSKSSLERAQGYVNTLVETIDREVKNLDPTNPEGKLFNRLNQLKAQLTAANAKLVSAEKNKNIIDKACENVTSLFESVINKLTKTEETTEDTETKEDEVVEEEKSEETTEDTEKAEDEVVEEEKSEETTEDTETVEDEVVEEEKSEETTEDTEAKEDETVIMEIETGDSPTVIITTPTEITQEESSSESATQTESVETPSAPATQITPAEVPSAPAAQSASVEESSATTTPAAAATAVVPTASSAVAAEATAVTVTPIVPETVESTATRMAGVAGVRADRTSEANGGTATESVAKESAGTVGEASGEEIVETNADLVSEKLVEGAIDMTNFEATMNKKTITTITDEKVPLAAFPEEENQKISWWWLLIIAILGTTGEEMYRRNKKKKEQAALDSKDNK